MRCADSSVRRSTTRIPSALAYTENLLGISVLVAPVYWLGHNAILTYNVALLLSFVTSALGAYLLAREVTGRRDAALVCACAFGFAPYRWAQLPHLQVLFVGWLALGLWALHRALRTHSWTMVGVAGLAILMQALANSYAAYQAALAAALVHRLGGDQGSGRAPHGAAYGGRWRRAGAPLRARRTRIPSSLGQSRPHARRP